MSPPACAGSASWHPAEATPVPRPPGAGCVARCWACGSVPGAWVGMGCVGLQGVGGPVPGAWVGVGRVARCGVCVWFGSVRCWLSLLVGAVWGPAGSVRGRPGWPGRPPTWRRAPCRRRSGRGRPRGCPRAFAVWAGRSSRRRQRRCHGARRPAHRGAAPGAPAGRGRGGHPVRAGRAAFHRWCMAYERQGRQLSESSRCAPAARAPTRTATSDSSSTSGSPSARIRM